MPSSSHKGKGVTNTEANLGLATRD